MTLFVAFYLFLSEPNPAPDDGIRFVEVDELPFRDLAALFRSRLLLIQIGPNGLTLEAKLDELDWRQSYSFVSFTRDGKRLISGATDGRILIWDLESNVVQKEIRMPSGFICGDLASDGNHLAVAYRGGAIYVLRLAE